jgi:hypothetical protein
MVRNADLSTRFFAELGADAEKAEKDMLLKSALLFGEVRHTLTTSRAVQKYGRTVMLRKT